MSVNSWIRRSFKNAVSVTDTLASGMGAGDTSFLFTDGSTYPTTNFMITVDQGKANEEKVLVAVRSGSAGTVASGGRGYNGTTAASHLAGASILHTIDQQDLDEANQVAVATLGAIAAKGDILTGSAANALAKTTVGADGTFLQAHAAAGGGVQWAAQAAFPIPPSCRVYLAVAIPLSSGVTTHIAFDTVDYDNNSAWSLGSNHYVVPVTGIYEVSFTATMDPGASTVTCLVLRTGSASLAPIGPSNSTTSPISGFISALVTVRLHCVVGDFISGEVDCTVGANLESGAGNTFLEIVQVST